MTDNQDPGGHFSEAAADFIVERFAHPMMMPEADRPTLWLQIYAEAGQAGIDAAACEWPTEYDEDFCRTALQGIFWLKARRLPPEMAAELDDADDAARGRARTVAEFVIANLPAIIPRPGSQSAWRILADASGLFPSTSSDEALPLIPILAQAILIEQHLRAGQRKH